VLVGACFDGSGINATDTLKNPNFKPHVALKPLLDWLIRHGPDPDTRHAATRAARIYDAWAATQASPPKQGELFAQEEDYS
jgi:putative DNA methylase